MLRYRFPVLPILATLSVLSFTLLPHHALCQRTTTSPTPSKRPPVAPRKSASSNTGVLVAFDAAADTLAIKDSFGQSFTYQLTEKTLAMKFKRLAQPSDFKPGETVALRLRKSLKYDYPLVAEMADPTTERWLRLLRSKTAFATLRQMGDSLLTVSVGSDEVSYKITDKTVWTRGGKDAPPTDFKPGEKIYIVPAPRAYGLPAARAIADTLSSAAQDKERFARTLSGVLQGTDANARTLILITATGLTRTLPYTDATQVTQGSHPLPLSILRKGLHVRVSLKRASGEDIVSRIVIGKGTRALGVKAPTAPR